jgi:hypothetical protein
MDERTTSRENATSQQWEHPLDSPVTIFWAAVSFFEMIFLVQSILEMIVILHRDYLACPPYVILASVDYSKHPVDLPLDGCAGSLLGHRPLRVEARRNEKKVTISPIAPSTMETISK